MAGFAADTPLMLPALLLEAGRASGGLAQAWHGVKGELREADLSSVKMLFQADEPALGSSRGSSSWEGSCRWANSCLGVEADGELGISRNLLMDIPRVPGVHTGNRTVCCSTLVAAGPFSQLEESSAQS
jgi:hypothetical protein